MDKSSINFFSMNLIMLFVVLSFIFIVFGLHRLAFVFELMLLLIFMFLFALSIFLTYHNKQFGWTVFGAALVVMIINLLLIFLLTKTFKTWNAVALFLSIAGLVLTFVNFKKSTKKSESEEKIKEKEKSYYPYIDKMEPREGKAVEEVNEQSIEIKGSAGKPSELEKTFTPGKYVASSKANKFHSPKCDWAKKIRKKNQVWLNSKEDAQSKGFEADKCVS